LPVGTEALAVICPLLIDRSPRFFSACILEFVKFDFLASNAEKWVINYKKMPIRIARHRNTRELMPYERLNETLRL
jgi:hypothetical protein